MHLFLDTEWADLEGTELVSLALVSSDGSAIFYAERDPLPPRPTEFVKNAVYPLLTRGSTALSDIEFTHRLRLFLAEAPSPHVVYDYFVDGDLLLRAISGFGLLSSELTECAMPPRRLRSSLLSDDRLPGAIDGYFLDNPTESLRRHHSLVDAHALRAAWLFRLRQPLPD